MKIIAVGDIHGRTAWRELAEKYMDQVVFIGDYVDSRLGLEDDDILWNFEEIITLKKENPNLVTLLLGNHDIQYLYYPRQRCSGFRTTYLIQMVKLFKENRDLFQIAVQYQNYLFTHAGVSHSWYKHHKTALDEYQGTTLAEALNAIHHSPDRDILFEVGPARGGYDAYSGPVWADKSETEDDLLDGFHQVVGHSRVDDITTYGTPQASITYIDVLTTRVKFYEVSINQ